MEDSSKVTSVQTENEGGEFFHTIKAMKGFVVLRKFNESSLELDANDAGKIVITLSDDGDPEMIVNKVFINVYRGEHNTYAISMRKLIWNKFGEFGLPPKDLHKKVVRKDKLVIPLPILLKDGDKVEFSHPGRAHSHCISFVYREFRIVK